jgi:glycosyltransferase involved in cell wall biosynthesis
MTPGKRVVFVTRADGIGHGGTEKHLFDPVGRLESASHEITIVTLGADPFSSRYEASQRVRVVLGPKSSRLPDALPFFRAMKADTIVFVNGDLGLFHWQMYLAARFSGARRVAAIEHLIALTRPDGSEDGGPARRSGWLESFLRRRVTTPLPGFACHVTLCVSDAVRNQLVAEYRYPGRKTITRRNGVDLRWFSRDAFSAAAPAILAGRPLGPVAVCIARFVPQKRIEVLIEAMKRVVARFPAATCVLVGGGFLEGELKAKVRELGLEETVLFAGETSDVRPYLAAADAFVLPSEREGLPLVLLEAMALGLPCIAAEAGGNREVIEDGVNGFVVPAGDAPRLAQAIEGLFAAPEEMAAMGRAARRTVEDRFDLEKTMSGVTAAIFGRTA